MQSLFTTADNDIYAKLSICCKTTFDNKCMAFK